MGSATTPRSSDAVEWLAEAALMLLHLSVVAGMIRLFDGGGWATKLTTIVIAAHGAAVVCRRLALPRTATAAVAAIGGSMVLAGVLFADATTYGLPTLATWDAIAASIDDARVAFREVMAPTPALTGFLVIAGVALWLSAWFADWAAFRLRTTVEAMVPAFVFFAFCTFLGGDEHRFLAASMFVSAAVLFAVAHRSTVIGASTAWVGATARVGAKSVFRHGLLIGVVAVLGGVLVATRLPGASDDVNLPWRQDPGSARDRTVLSPILDLKRRIVAQSDTVLFTVDADRPSYWRITGLDEFDGRLWQIDKRFSAARGDLASTNPSEGGPGIRIEQKFRIGEMNELWVPAAFEPRKVEGPSVPLRWDPESSTLIVDDSVTGTANITYGVTSVLPSHTPAELDAATADVPRELRRFTELPADFPAEVADTAAEVTRGAPTPYRRARALQEWFRSDRFTYSTQVRSGHDDDHLVAFLRDREGYCEQFAGAFAAMARSLGIPSRVAIGFTQGDPDPANPGRYVVSGRHAHAWPEVYLSDIGWVPFEPTPGRGMPGAEGHTGVAPAQDDSGGTQSADPGLSTTTDAGTASSEPPGPTPTSSVESPSGPGTPEPAGPGGEESAPASGDSSADDADRDDAGGLWHQLVVALVAAVALWVSIVVLAPLVRRRSSADPAARIDGSWQDAVAAVERVTGVGALSAETHLEFAQRATPAVGDLAGSLTELARLATSAAWRGSSPDPASVHRAGSLAHEIDCELERRDHVLRRIRRSVSPLRALTGRPRPRPPSRQHT